MLKRVNSLDERSVVVEYRNIFVNDIMNIFREKKCILLLEEPSSKRENCANIILE